MSQCTIPIKGKLRTQKLLCFGDPIRMLARQVASNYTRATVKELGLVTKLQCLQPCFVNISEGDLISLEQDEEPECNLPGSDTNLSYLDHHRHTSDHTADICGFQPKSDPSARQDKHYGVSCNLSTLQLYMK